MPAKNFLLLLLLLALLGPSAAAARTGDDGPGRWACRDGEREWICDDTEDGARCDHDRRRWTCELIEHLTRIRVRERLPLRFGNVITDPRRPGRVVILPSGERRLEGGATDMGGRYNAAEFAIVGMPGRQFSVLLPEEIELRGRNGTLTIRDFTTDSPETLRLNRIGLGRIGVGATLHMKPGQSSGHYRGRIPISVQYE
ncbi:DUF4402 domain-containing protein [Roseospirillum parvum]|uniref:DUF4402 domain-containing protein n=1 Tax=Roseospirillum parvum TaxID=83401 RepID=A0A1G8FA99_9PROT|nr:DUF4402 domain-containing protein [Roseospirillum parvum]SDH79040.1 protein of unknown function [Roseospirillum parvum]